MQKDTIFEVIHLMEKTTDKMILSWMKQSNNDLGVSHILVLNELRKNGKSIPSDIARTLSVTPASLTHLTTKLLKKELVNRQNDHNDRRKYYLSITDKGVQVLNEAQEIGTELKFAWLQHLSAEELDHLLSIYKKLDRVTE